VAPNSKTRRPGRAGAVTAQARPAWPGQRRPRIDGAPGTRRHVE